MHITASCLLVFRQVSPPPFRSLDSNIGYQKKNGGDHAVQNPTVISPTLKRIVEEHLKSQLPSGAAPLAGLDDEEDPEHEGHSVTSETALSSNFEEKVG